MFAKSTRCSTAWSQYHREMRRCAVGFKFKDDADIVAVDAHNLVMHAMGHCYQNGICKVYNNIIWVHINAHYVELPVGVGMMTTPEDEGVE